MMGAIIGDIVGSTREAEPVTHANFKLFVRGSRPTDDSVMTIATADAILNSGVFAEYYKKWGLEYINAGYGPSFLEWLIDDDSSPYNSFGNGSAMRVSPIGWVCKTLDETIQLAILSAECTHNHAEGIKGAIAVAGAIFLARTGNTKEAIKSWIVSELGYDLDRKYDDIKKDYQFDISCQGSVPEAIICFLESNSFEDAIRKAIDLKGDADTQAAIAGSIAEAFYGIPEELIEKAQEYLEDDMLDVIKKFRAKYMEEF